MINLQLKKVFKLIVLFLTLVHAYNVKDVQINEVDGKETTEFPLDPTEPPVEMMMVFKNQCMSFQQIVFFLSVIKVTPNWVHALKIVLENPGTVPRIPNVLLVLAMESS